MMRRILYSLAAIIMMPLLVGVAGLTMIHIRGDRLLSIHGTSMQPTIMNGDAVIIEPIIIRSLRVGQIISYTNPSDRTVLITHRIIDIKPKTGLVTTAGDNRHSPDTSISPTLIVGRATTRAPMLGRAIDNFKSPLGLAISIYLPALLIVVAELRRIITYFTRPGYLLDYTYDAKGQKT